MDTKRQYRIALAGNPNSGKTTLFNALTGLRYKVANYPGVTVEKKHGKIELGELSAEVIDLPGIYSIAGTSADERIATEFLTGQLANELQPDLIIAVVDASNLERNLYLTTQLIDLGIPVIIALNMWDLASRLGISIKKEVLAAALDVPVVALTANKREGIEDLKREAEKMLKSPSLSKKQFAWLQESSPYFNAAQELGQIELSRLRKRLNAPEMLVGAALFSELLKPADAVVEKKRLELQTELELHGIDSISFEATGRYQLTNWLTRRASVQVAQDAKSFIHRLDSAITHRFWGVIIFLVIMAVIFQAIFTWAKVPTEWIDSAVSWVQNLVSANMEQGPLRSLLVDGILAGVGSVLVFVPQIAILFLFLGLLEDSGYLSRAAFIMDRIMRQVGLQGRSFIPLLSSFACAIPGIMATRTIPSFADRMVTILVAPLMSCSARLPVYTLLIAAIIPDHQIFGFIALPGLVLLSMYLLGVIGAAGVAWILKLSVLRGKPALFIMEMPPFRMPDPLVVLREVYDRVMQFIKGAGTVILACSIILWFLASFPKGDIKHTYAGIIGTSIEPVIKPLGFNWEIGVGILSSFAAREVFITSLATVYNLQSEDDTSHSVLQKLRQKKAEGTFPVTTALSLMVFYVFACQCMSTLAVCRRETNSYRWPAFMFIYMTTLAYIFSWVTFRVATQLL